MRTLIHFISIILLAAAFTSCTSARWTVKDKNATDKSEYEVLEEQQFLSKSGELSPQNPVLRLDLLSRTKYRYTQRVLAERNIQDYRPRPGFLLIGITSSALAFLAANSDIFVTDRSPTHRWTLNAVGALLAASGFLNMEPVGEPRPTGEERFLRSSGEIVQIDTVQVQDDVETNSSITVRYRGQQIYKEENRTISNGQLEIPLADELNELQPSGPNPDSVQVEVVFKDSLYNYRYPLSRILEPYARVTSPLTSLRNSQNAISEDNIVADLVEGSQVKIASTEDELWYRVLYGISEHYVLKEDAEIVWRSTDFADKNEVVTVPRLPFGEIDVESNIPILSNKKQNAIALIITNQNYSGSYEHRSYAHRDGRLIRTYLETALGYPQEQVFEIQDLSDPQRLDKTLSEMRFAANDSTELIVYLSGYTKVEDEENRTISMLGVNEAGEEPSNVISLQKFFEQLGTITSGQTLVLNDFDFSSSGTSELSDTEGQEILESNTSAILENNNAAVLFGNRVKQSSRLYVSQTGDDRKHHIFPYYFAKALQQRNTNLSKIYQYLERNISYTARKLHDRPQDPLLLGNTLLDLATE